MSKTFMAVAVSSALTLALGQAQAQQAQAQQAQPAQAGQAQQAGPQWKDRAEYDLVQEIGKATDGAKKLALLDDWTKKYPNTDFKVARMVQYLEAYRLLNQRDKMLETAKQILAEDPKNLTAIYWTAIIVPMGNLSAEDSEFGARCARMLADDLESLRPAGVADDAWKQTKDAMKLDAVGQRALGYLAMQAKDYVEAERRLRANLELNPADAEGAYWLGSSLIGQKKVELQSDALFFIARAAAYDGPGAVDEARRKTLLEYVTNAYNTYHGKDEAGLQELLATAKANAMPPTGFKILSEAEVKEHQVQQIAASDPAMALWIKLKDAAKADPNYFEAGMKGALIPPEGEPPFRGTVISATPERAPKEVVLAISEPNTPEVTLKVIDTALPGPAAPGTTITFRGVATELIADPYMVTFEVEREHITGWPSSRPATKKAAPKKK
ncbi:MAG: tetratricopeptide repeat protein [bacterium]